MKTKTKLKSKSKKHYQIIYKFSDVIDNIEASSQEEAKKIAGKRLTSYAGDPQIETECYEVEVEEMTL